MHTWILDIVNRFLRYYVEKFQVTTLSQNFAAKLPKNREKINRPKSGTPHFLQTVKGLRGVQSRFRMGFSGGAGTLAAAARAQGSCKGRDGARSKLGSRRGVYDRCLQPRRSARRRNRRREAFFRGVRATSCRSGQNRFASGLSKEEKEKKKTQPRHQLSEKRVLSHSRGQRAAPPSVRCSQRSSPRSQPPGNQFLTV